jgi:hypothetical protein
MGGFGVIAETPIARLGQPVVGFDATGQAWDADWVDGQLKSV